jgi:hypothetical protein
VQAPSATQRLSSSSSSSANLSSSDPGLADPNIHMALHFITSQLERITKSLDTLDARMSAAERKLGNL